MSRLALRSCHLGLVVLLAATTSGCFSDSSRKVILGKISGKVTLEGEPLKPGCVLTFLPSSAGAEIGSALIRDDGTYVAISGDHPGVPIGDYRVLVSPPKMDPKEEEELTKKNSQAVMTALIKKDRRELEKVEYPQDAIVPRKYWAETTSGLTCSVKEGENTADFELTRPEKKK